jgi:hypothetical protein
MRKREGQGFLPFSDQKRPEFPERIRSTDYLLVLPGIRLKRPADQFANSRLRIYDRVPWTERRFGKTESGSLSILS